MLFPPKENMTPLELSAWREAHRETCEELEAIRTRELAALTEERAGEIIQWLSFPMEKPEGRKTSGLVEQQAIFHRRKW